MAQYFYIKKGSTLNPLRMELIDDGKYDFMKNQHFNNAIQKKKGGIRITREYLQELGETYTSNYPRMSITNWKISLKKSALTMCII